jgi:hypothetical protein
MGTTLPLCLHAYGGWGSRLRLLLPKRMHPALPVNGPIDHQDFQPLSSELRVAKMEAVLDRPGGHTH